MNSGYQPKKTNDKIPNPPNTDTAVSKAKHGQWYFEEYPDGYYHSECSLCGKWFSEEAYLHKWKYCPNCGAKMDEVNDDSK